MVSFFYLLADIETKNVVQETLKNAHSSHHPIKDYAGAF